LFPAPATWRPPLCRTPPPLILFCLWTFNRLHVMSYARLNLKIRIPFSDLPNDTDIHTVYIVSVCLSNVHISARVFPTWLQSVHRPTMTQHGPSFCLHFLSVYIGFFFPCFWTARMNSLACPILEIVKLHYIINQLWTYYLLSRLRLGQYLIFCSTAR
jgi:hypothetical protein